MNLKEEFRDSLQNTFDVNNIPSEVQEEILTDALNANKFLLEKLIEDIPDDCGYITCDSGICLQALKQQLRKEWL